MRLIFKDRADAARVLARELWRYADGVEALVLALPRGGVPVAAEIAKTLGAELDVMVVRKVGVPGREELAMGAVAMGGIRVKNPDVAALAPRKEFDAAADREMNRVEERLRAYRGDRPLPKIRGRTVILVDDGLATGSTMRAAIEAVRQFGPERVVVAVPVAPAHTVEKLEEEADEVICPSTPEGFRAISQFYEDFSQVSDGEVRQLLARERSVEEVGVEVGGEVLPGTLVLPPGAWGVVLFAHGSGSSRHSPRNQRVASALNEAGFGTLLFDLLTPEEEAVDAATRELRFDIARLADRLTGAVDWVKQRPRTSSLAIGLFGASTGAAAALVAAARRPDAVGAVVSRGGRPDLAGESLSEVRAPTLLIVGGDDTLVIELNRRAAQQMNAKVELEIVEGATHLFEEPGKLDEVAKLAHEWFERSLAGRRAVRSAGYQR